MRQHKQRQVTDAKRLETGQQGLRFCSGVDKSRALSRANDQRIPLPDVAGRVPPIARDAAAQVHGLANERADVGDKRHAQQQREPGSPAMDEQHKGDNRDKAQDGAWQAARPRQERAWPAADGHGDEPDPLRRQPRQPQERLPEPGSELQEQTADKPDQGRDWRRRGGEHVRGHTVERQLGRQEEKNRLARELRRGGQCQEKGQRARHDAREAIADRGREGQEAKRGEHRERETVVAAPPRIDDQHNKRRQRQERQSAHPTRRGLERQHNCRHDAGPDDAALWRDERDERGQQHRGEHKSSAAPKPEETPDHEHGGDDDGTVRTGDSSEVRQHGGLHLTVQLGCHQARVADREAREQLCTGPRQPASRAHDGVARPGCRLKETVGSLDDTRRPVEEEHGRDAVAGVGRTELALELNPRTDARNLSAVLHAQPSEDKQRSAAASRSPVHLERVEEHLEMRHLLDVRSGPPTTLLALGNSVLPHERGERSRRRQRCTLGCRGPEHLRCSDRELGPDAHCHQ
nr:hypothetical protein [Pseudoclavibacter sp. AY1F1]